MCQRSSVFHEPPLADGLPGRRGDGDVQRGAGSKAAPSKAPRTWCLQPEVEQQHLPFAGTVLRGSVKEPETGFPEQPGMKRLFPPPNPWFAFKHALGASPWAAGMEKLLRRQDNGGSAPLQWLQVTNPRENRDGNIVLGSDRWVLVDADGE